MVVLDRFVQVINRHLGPIALRYGLNLRYALQGGVIRESIWRDQFAMLPLAYRILSAELRDTWRLEQEKKLHGSSNDWLGSFLSSGTISSSTAESKQEVAEQDSTAPSSTTTATDDATAATAHRMKLLEGTLRPALIPNERWSDVLLWQFHHRTVQWARTEYLMAVHWPTIDIAGPLVLKGRYSEQPILPTSKTIITALQLQDWAVSKTPPSVHIASLRALAQQSLTGGNVMVARGGGLAVAYVEDSDQDVSKLPLATILELAAGGLVQPCGALNALCEQADAYQLWTKEYIAGLGDYVWQRAQERETIVVDVGAGDGLLINFLRQYLQGREGSSSIQLSMDKKRKKASATPVSKKSKKSTHIPQLIATDDDSWNIEPKATVESLSYEQALAKYAIHVDIDEGNEKPQIIVLCSWMPMGDDWTTCFREYKVDEYILIGECDDGQCGDNWLTWGNPYYREDYEELLQGESSVIDKATATVDLTPPYQQDGYERVELDYLHQFQFSRFDSRVSKTGKTISFRRQPYGLI